MNGVEKLLLAISKDWHVEQDVVFGGEDEAKRDIIKIAADLNGLYRDNEAIRQFLREPQKMLNNRSPLDLIVEGRTDATRDYVAYLSGR